MKTLIFAAIPTVYFGGAFGIMYIKHRYGKTGNKGPFDLDEDNELWFWPLLWLIWCFVIVPSRLCKDFTPRMLAIRVARKAEAARIAARDRQRSFR